MIRRFAAAACVLAATASFAQEIGKELPPDKANQPTTSNPTTYDNPYAPPPTVPAPETPQPKAAAAVRAVPGATKGQFGLRTGFGGGGFSAPAGSSASLDSPSVGFAYFATDSAAITFDLGAALALNSSTALFAFAAGIGVDIHFGPTDKPVRPFFTIGADLVSSASNRGLSFGMTADLGLGGEYWFSDYFSVNARVIALTPISFDTGTLAVATISPGLGATVWF